LDDQGKKQRTCRACRKKKNKKELWRLVILGGNTLEVDPRQIMPGRGWYLCREENCLSCLKAKKMRHKCFGRDLEITPELNTLITKIGFEEPKT
jgi:predicted RNA-binding protein YlxR (DUF448 family)